MNIQKLVVVTNVFGPLNLGDFELFSALVEKVHKCSDRVSLSAIARDPELSKGFFPRVAFYEQLGKAEGAGLRLLRLSASLLFVKWKFPARVLLPKAQYDGLVELTKADLVMGCPGGFLEDSSCSFYSHLIQVFLAKKLAKKYMLAPMSIGPVRNRINKFLLLKVLKGIDAIYVRERTSLRLCESLGVECKLSNDLAFDKFQNSVDSVASSSSYFCMTIIDWSFPSAPDVASARKAYLDALSRTAVYVSRNFGLSLKIIVQVASDMPAIKDFCALLDGQGVDYCLVTDDLTPDNMMNLISKARLVIASRFHSAIFALNVGTPVIAISYLPKTTGMLDLYDAKELYVDIETVTSDRLINIAQRFLLNPGEFLIIRSKFAKRLTEVGSVFVNDLERVLS
ncbi:hypothetical protein DWB84_18715 [Saccharophagus sp. K07]|uniref:polysaccharide pyruvyl transferase family protein n=1 Tax=Saccharophagus sp. K07 TaxID=2283636 RepID=UPI001651EC2A|nr:polysaccharide pyruvyl transferase family protein [Saccharophagus sp. K07]MBC6907473.1 hypothetical protein [Saccharophagus sp. K07]